MTRTNQGILSTSTVTMPGSPLLSSFWIFPHVSVWRGVGVAVCARAGSDDVVDDEPLDKGSVAWDGQPCDKMLHNDSCV